MGIVSGYLELSHPVIDVMRIDPGTRGSEPAGNTGTFMHAPWHQRADRADIAALPAERLVNVPIVVVRAVGRWIVTAAHLGDPGELWGRAVLVHTGWDRHWGTSGYLRPGPHLDGGAARALVEANVACVGIDSVDIDDMADPRRPVHAMLLGNDIPVIEHLCGLAALPDTGARLHALPPPVAGVGSFPVRVVAAWEP